MPTGEMSKLCRQVSIESPGFRKEWVSNASIPIPDCPPNGARILVCYAGACYQSTRQSSMSMSISMGTNVSNSIVSDLRELALQTQVFPLQPQQIPAIIPEEGEMSDVPMPSPVAPSMPAHQGIKDGALFPGFEVAGTIESLGTQVDASTCGFKVGQRVILYPYEGAPAGYSEQMVVPELKYLIPVPDSLALSVAAMLPTGALLAQSIVLAAHKIVADVLAQRPEDGVCKILIVGTGGLALWAVRIAADHFYHVDYRHRVQITVASLRDEGFQQISKDFDRVNVVQWSEDLYESQLIERTHDACNGLVDIAIDFGTTSRSLHRCMQCLCKGGVVLVSDEVGEKLLPKFAKRAIDRGQRIQAVPLGDVAELHNLVKLVASNEIKPPPHSVFPVEKSAEVIKKLCQSEIPGRAILKFHDVE